MHLIYKKPRLVLITDCDQKQQRIGEGGKIYTSEEEARTENAFTIEMGYARIAKIEWEV